jgi:hypothetical protein
VIAELTIAGFDTARSIIDLVLQESSASEAVPLFLLGAAMLCLASTLHPRDQRNRQEIVAEQNPATTQATAARQSSGANWLRHAAATQTETDSPNQADFANRLGDA